MNKLVMSETSRKLRQLRGNRPRKDVALALEISENALCSYERGQRIPRDEVKNRIATFYGVSKIEIFLLPNDTISDKNPKTEQMFE